MDYATKTTEELEQLLRDDCNSEMGGLDLAAVMPAMEELARRHGKRTRAETKIAWKMFLRHYLPTSQEELIDPDTGIQLEPSWQGEFCAGVDLCCEECDFYLLCYPNWRDFVSEGFTSGGQN